MMAKIQRFGAAMFVPVLLFSIAGIVVGLGSLFNNPTIFGSIAEPGTVWNSVWNTISNGGWTVFRQEALLFVVGLPIGLANQSKGRAAMEAVMIYLTYNYFINSMLTYWGKFFGVSNFATIQIPANSSNQGITEICGIRTLDTSIVGALIIAGIVVWLHNKYFDKKLPDWLGTFQGSTYIYFLGFFLMLPVAFLTCLMWPKLQLGITGMQHFIVSSGMIGIWIYEFLSRILIPTGLHHLINVPFQAGPAVIAGGLQPYWLKHLTEFAQSTKPLSQLAPFEGFQIYGNEKIFLVPAICLSFYATAKKSKKLQTKALMIPTALTAVLAGVTEPVDFTYLFAAPVLWVIYSVLSATMNTVMWCLGLRGNMTDGAIGIAAQNWIPLWQNHWQTYVMEFIVGIIFAVITFFIFKFMILKFNYITPGREADDEEVHLLNKKEYKEKKAEEKQARNSNNPYEVRAEAYLQLLGGSQNIEEISSCATRLRVTVKDPKQVGTDGQFRANKAVSVVRHGKAIQVIVGLDVTQVLEKMQALMDQEGSGVQAEDEEDTTTKQAVGLLDLLGGAKNINKVDSCATRLRLEVVDPTKVAEDAKLKELGVYNIERKQNNIEIVTGLNADEVAEKIKSLM